MRRTSRWAASACSLALVQLAIAANAGAVIPAPPSGGPPPHGRYVALGDSYSSGVGAPPYFSSSGGCNRSPQGYPEFVAGADNYRLVFVACSGATSVDVLNHQLNALTKRTKLVTLTIGGDDVNFSNVMKDCVLYRWSCAKNIHKAEHIAQTVLPGRLGTLFTAIRARAPHAKVFVLGYPHFFRGTCGGFEPFGADQRRINTGDDILDGVIGHAATTYGFTPIDPRAAFTDHSVCGHPPWIHGASTSNTGLDYHPYVGGYVAYAELVERALG